MMIVDWYGRRLKMKSFYEKFEWSICDYSKTKPIHFNANRTLSRGCRTQLGDPTLMMLSRKAIDIFDATICW